MNFTIVVLFLLIFLVTLCFVFISRKRRKQLAVIESLVSEKEALEKSFNELKANTPSHQFEKEQAELEKKKMAEKNRKLWQMSETVHKERRKVDEDNERLTLEKEKLEGEKKKLDEKVKKLWSTSTAIHKEKERINELKIEIEHKHQEILDSVNYAKRIQNALLASDALLKENLPEHFVLFQPKDIVSGDFYWGAKLNENNFSLVTADSTGHGVPGAIMSILNISCLSEAVNAEKLILPNEILDYTRKRIMEHMANDGSIDGGKDGMDALICNFDFKNNKLQFAAANNSLWLIRNNELVDYKADKMPVGKPMGEIKPFTLQEIQLEKGDLIIAFTDGFADQFGGPYGKKFMYKPLKELLININQLSLKDIKKELKSKFNQWKSTAEQVDDVLIIGVRI
ncbi:PP2C family protein-serine/threonine phosphatase [Aurantibacillus circumpalustris]|uniref:PP2C family protein-serine/threonine phosphatase n=1 Tax=Aurantibacillus circumpalustris TaxID=3036359 RepID=UPI00295A68F3|nr:SpoIIE family protein phosphatase [Aurantibacillus circumpalustris]